MNTLNEEIKHQQPVLYRQISKALQFNRINHAYIVQGEEQTIQLKVAQWICQGLVCEHLTPQGQPCGNCRPCRLMGEQEYADLMVLEPEGQVIKVDQIRQMQSFFTSRGIESREKFLWIMEADKLNRQSSNSLLKFIEEPTGEFYTFFLTKNNRILLPTIQSRCQLLKLTPYAKSELHQQLNQIEPNSSYLDIVVEQSNSLEQAQALLNDEWFKETVDILNKWLHYLTLKEEYSFVFVQQHLMKQAKDKQEQQKILDLLLTLIQLKIKSQLNSSFSKEADYVKMIVNVTEAKQKLASHVSFQSVCEQLAWRTMTSG